VLVAKDWLVFKNSVFQARPHSFVVLLDAVGISFVNLTSKIFANRPVDRAAPFAGFSCHNYGTPTQFRSF